MEKIEKPKAKHYSESDFGTPTLNGMPPSNPSSQGSGKSEEEEVERV